MISNIYTEQYTMFPWVMGGRVGIMGPIPTSTITINILYNILRGSVAGIFRPISISAIINTYILPHVTIIMTYTSPPITINATAITPLSAIITISYSLINIICLFGITRRN